VDTYEQGATYEDWVLMHPQDLEAIEARDLLAKGYLLVELIQVTMDEFTEAMEKWAQVMRNCADNVTRGYHES
jgi:hypothetical protein